MLRRPNSMPTAAAILLSAAIATAQTPCPVPTPYGTGTPGTGSLIPTIATWGTPLLGSASFAVRADNMPGGTLVARLLGLSQASIPVYGIEALVGAPVLTLDVASTAGVATFPIPIPNIPGLAGLPLFAQMIGVDSGAAQGLSASQGMQFGICGVNVTNVDISDTVRLSGAKRLGLNIGGHDRWGASKILKNQLPNPGFEPGVFGTVWLADPSSTSDLYVPRDWNTNSGNQPAGFWDGAAFELVYGPGAGASGSVQTFTHNGGDYHFDLGSNGGTPLDDRDVMFTRRTFTSISGMNSGVGAADTVNPYSGNQSLRLQPGDDFTFVMDTSWRDGDQSSHKLLVVEGDWRIRLKARGANAGDQIRVRYFRDGGAPYNPTFLDRTFNLGSSWATYQEDQTIAVGTDQTPEPWPTGVYRPALTFAIDVPASNTGDIWIDEVELYRVDDASNATVFSDRFVQRLVDYRPGVLRWWAGQLGNTLENMTRSWPQRATAGYKPSSTTPQSWNYGVSDFLQLCAHVGAEPWIVMPPTASQSDLLGFMEYLAGTSGSMATRRSNQGQAAPWTSVFDKIHLEWGNELWGTGTPGDPFGGASVAGGVRLGNLADRAFEFMKASSWYAASASKLDFVIGGQAGYSGRQQEIEANANDHHSTALAPYFGSLSNFATTEEIYGPLFARPFYEAFDNGGSMLQSKQHLVNGGNGTNLSIYEVNYHTTQIIPGLTSQQRNEYVAGASGAVALPLTMLLYMTELGAREQCAFAACGYSFRFDTSGGWPGAQNQFVQVWGMLRDLYHYDLRRPTWLGVELANRAIMGDAITTTQTGDNPTWTQSAINGVGAATTVPYVQSFAFRDGNGYGVVLMNLSLDEHQGVRLNVPGSPQAAAKVFRIEPSNIADINATSEIVTMNSEVLADFHQAYEMILPPHSIRAVVWRN